MQNNKNNDESKKDDIMALIDVGAEIAGGAVGGAIGFFAEGLVGGAVLGAGGVAAARMLKHLGQEVSERLLGPREKVRVGGVIAIAASEINERIEKGDNLRSDGFFKENSTRRSDAEEVAESVILKSQREPEERKIKYMGYLLANIAFDEGVSAQMAHQLVKSAEQLTFRQLCIIKLAAVKKSSALRQQNYRGQSSFPRELYELLYECYDLYAKGFVNFGGGVALGLTDVEPSKMTLQGFGVELFRLMKLNDIPDKELIPIAIQLR